MPQESACLDIIEFRTLLVKCADMINSRPIGVLLAEDDLQPLTPNHLLIGWASSGQVSQELLIDGTDKYCKRTKYVAELSSQWWNLWMSRVFTSLLPFKSWPKRQRNLETGDIVLVEHKVKLGKNSYRMARVVDTHPDNAGLVWRVTLEARPRGGLLGLPYTPKNLERFQMAVQRLVLIHPK